MKFSHWSFGIFLLISIGCTEKKQMEETYSLFVGTYTNGDSEGIYKLDFNPNSGSLDSMRLMAKLPNPSFLVFSSDKQYLYAVQETADFDSLGGGVTSFVLKNGLLKALNSMGTGGAHPCHVAFSQEGQIAVSNYTGGNLSVFDLETDGSLGKKQLIDHKVLDTTKASHIHKAHFNEDGLFTSDLGLDGIKRYMKKEDSWQSAHQASIDLPEGAGPRHFVFNTDRSFLYAINELNATITVFKRDDEGSYNPIQTEDTLAPDWEGGKSCADIHLSPDGRFLYGSNRGENTIVTFSVDGNTGKIGLVARESVRGDWPRNFTIDPSGNFLLVANERSNNISVFKRNVENGTLEFLNEIKIGAPVCLVFQ
ncbi:lactonase family protein [Flagellimonas sp. S174]|uniref:lactonase family protein n=1 Tax=Flagellimonas sp. S174 TaxID=3410790 RepID=UPI003BF50F58